MKNNLTSGARQYALSKKLLPTHSLFWNILRVVRHKIGRCAWGCSKQAVRGMIFCVDVCAAAVDPIHGPRVAVPRSNILRRRVGRLTPLRRSSASWTLRSRTLLKVDWAVLGVLLRPEVASHSSSSAWRPRHTDGLSLPVRPGLHCLVQFCPRSSLQVSTRSTS